MQDVSTNPQHWDCRPDETTKAYKAFNIYRGLDPQQRSVDEAYRRYSRGKAAAKGQQRAASYFFRWSVKHNWVARAQAWDAHLQAEQQRQERETWLARQRELRETEWTMASELIARAETLLRWPLQEERLDRDGKTIIVKPARWRLRDAEALLSTASRLQRLASGMATSHNEISGPDRTPLLEPHLDLEDLSDDELSTLLNLLEKAEKKNKAIDTTSKRLEGKPS